MRDENIWMIFKPIKIGSGHYSYVYRKYLSWKKNNRKCNAYIWIDKDVYIRNEHDNYDNYQISPIKDSFRFNYMNFEDFLVLHLSIEKINEWQDICNLKNHFVNPLCSRDYLSLFKEKMISDYEKGSFPIKIFNMNTIKNLIKNNNDENILISSEFINLLEEELSSYLEI